MYARNMTELEEPGRIQLLSMVDSFQAPGKDAFRTRLHAIQAFRLLPVTANLARATLITSGGSIAVTVVAAVRLPLPTVSACIVHYCSVEGSQITLVDDAEGIESFKLTYEIQDYKTTEGLPHMSENKFADAAKHADAIWQ